MTPQGRRFPQLPVLQAGSVAAFAPPDCSNLHLTGCVSVPRQNVTHPVAAVGFTAPNCAAAKHVGCIVTPEVVPARAGMTTIATALQFRDVAASAIASGSAHTLALAFGDVDGDGGAPRSSLPHARRDARARTRARLWLQRARERP